MQRKYFGTDGIRGPYGKSPMTAEFLYRTGKASAHYFGGKGNLSFAIGRDTRASGPTLENAFCRGVEEEGGHCHRLGVIPTGGVAIYTRARHASAGVMISASHNPYSDNGIKFFNSNGFKLPDDAEWAIERLIDLHNSPSTDGVPSATNTPELDFHADAEATRIYHNTIRATLPESFSLNGYHLFIDASHGAAYRTTPDFLESLGATVTRLHTSPDGMNINAQCGSQHTDTLCASIHQHSANTSSSNPRTLGLAHDGDADRLIMIDEEGIPLDGDELLAILGVGMLKNHTLAQNTLVTTLMSNLGLDECLAQHGGHVKRTDVGDRYVLEAMLDNSLNLGGEQSGHMIFLDHLPTGDGLLSAVQTLRYIQESGQPLCKLRRILHKFPQKLFNLKVRVKINFSELPDVREQLIQAENQLGKNGRISLRYSGTENLARLLIEARDASLIDPLANSILTPMRHAIGA